MRIANLFKYALLTVLMAALYQTQAQCPNNNVQYGTSTAPSAINVQTTLSSCLYGGEYRYVSGLVSGSQYNVQTCGDSDFDTQITVYDAVTGAFVAYNDDACGLQSSVNFVSNGNPVRVLIDRFNCSNQSSCMTLRMTRITGPSSVNPCNSITTLSCGNSESFSLNGAGVWLPGGPWGTPGQEAVYEFTAQVSGAHSVAVTNSGFYVDLFVSTACGPSGWTYIDDILSSSTNSVNLTAGVTYYFLIDDENTSSSNGTITVNCPTPAVDPCTQITNITACDQSFSYSLGAGNGQFDGNGPWGEPGKEAVFSYTAPVTASYEIDMTHSGGGWSDLFIGTSCGPTGWTYIDDVLSSASNTVNLTAGVTYYFLIDDENTSPSSGTININCPCIGPANGIDGSYTITGTTNIAGNTDGACNDCSFRASEDQTWEMNIPCAGTYTFSTCNNATWDTYLYLSSAPCSGVLAFNDDNCGLRSSITYTFSSGGTYYLTVEGFSSSSRGAYSVDVTKSCNVSVNLSSSLKRCGYNVSCNGSTDGDVTSTVAGICNGTYAWSNGASSADLSGVGAGTYTLNVSDGFGCSGSASITLTEPDPLVVDAGTDQVVYFGYAPQACADLQGAATGGCAAYSYAWSSGDNTANSTVCPSSTTTYTLNVTDQNGCTASDDVTVCVVDVTCNAGNSNNRKVEVCHIPPGNPNNAHTICINASAVPAHLAIGCQLGACDELANTCGSSSNRQIVSDVEYAKAAISAMPNPFENRVDISLTFPIGGEYNIVLMDINGKVIRNIYAGNFDSFENQVISMDTDQLTSGVYVVAALDSNGFVAQTERIIKR